MFYTRPLNPISGSDLPVTTDKILGIVENYKINFFLSLKLSC